VIDAGGTTSVRALGVREHRRVARHVAHCQPCRRYAWAAGVDDAVLKPPSVAEKIAALLPIPAFLRWRRHGGKSDAANASSSHSIASLQTATQTVAQLAGPSSPAAGLGRVAAAVAAVAVAGGGVVAGISTQQGSKPAPHKSTPAAGSISSPPGGGAHHGALAANHLSKAVIASKTAGSTSGSSATSSSTGGSSGSTASSQSTAQQGSNPSASTASASTSSSTKSGSTTVHLPSIPSLPKAQLPSLPKINLPGLPPLDVSSLTKPVSTTVNQTLGLVKNTLGTG
jgi:hypothetical protein